MHLHNSIVRKALRRILPTPNPSHGLVVHGSHRQIMCPFQQIFLVSCLLFHLRTKSCGILLTVMPTGDFEEGHKYNGE